MDDEIPGVVFDIGSLISKIGIAGDDSPRDVFYSVVEKVEKKSGKTDPFIGDEAYSKRKMLELIHPIKKGIIEDWENFDLLLNHSFRHLMKVDPTQHILLASEVPFNLKANRQRFTEMIFENYNFLGFYLATQTILALYASGRTTGMVIDSGYQVTHITPIYEGWALRNLSSQIEIGGKDSSLYLMNKLMEKGILSEQLDLDLIRDIKRKHAYTALNLEMELDSEYNLRDYELPDGKILKIGRERFECAELLFQPSLIQSNSPPIQNIIFQSVYSKAESEYKKELFGNIVLSGGNTMLPGITDRFHKEICSIATSPTRINVIAPPERKSSVWIGGSILASLSTFQYYYINKSDYDEFGSNIVNLRCF